MYDPGRCRGGGFGRRAKKVVKMISPVRVFLSLFLKKKKKKTTLKQSWPLCFEFHVGRGYSPLCRSVDHAASIRICLIRDTDKDTDAAY